MKKAKPKRRMTALDRAKAEIAELQVRLNAALGAQERAHDAAGRNWDRAEKAETTALQAEDRQRALDILAGDMASAVSTAAKALKKDAKARAITSHSAALHLESLALRSWQRQQEIRSMRVVRGEAMAVTNECKA